MAAVQLVNQNPNHAHRNAGIAGGGVGCHRRLLVVVVVEHVHGRVVDHPVQGEHGVASQQGSAEHAGKRHNTRQQKSAACLGRHFVFDCFKKRWSGYFENYLFGRFFRCTFGAFLH